MMDTGMLISTATTSSNAAPVAAGRADERDKGQDDAPAGINVHSNGTAFDVLLAATRIAIGSGPAAQQDALASQMFEPKVEDQQQATRQSLEQANREDSNASRRGDRLDATSVRARRAAAATAPPEPQRHPSVQTADRRGDDTGKPTVTDARERTPWSSEVSERDISAKRVEARASAEGREAVARSSANNAAPAPAAPAVPAQQMARTEAPQPAGGVRAVSATSAAKAGGTTGSSIAQQMGQLLSAPRGGEAEAARPSSESSTPQRPDQQSAHKTTSNQTPGQASSSDRASAGDDVKSSPFDQLIRSIRLRTSAQNSTARMHLQPPELGRVLVNVRLSGDELQVEVRTETSQARDVLLERSAGLRAALEQHGIRVGQFEVTGDLTTAGGDSDDPAEDPSVFTPARGEEHRKERSSPSATRSEIAVPDDDAVSEQGRDVAMWAVGDRRLDVRI